MFLRHFLYNKIKTHKPQPDPNFHRFFTLSQCKPNPTAIHLCHKSIGATIVPDNFQ